MEDVTRGGLVVVGMDGQDIATGCGCHERQGFRAVGRPESVHFEEGLAVGAQDGLFHVHALLLDDRLEVLPLAKIDRVAVRLTCLHLTLDHGARGQRRDVLGGRALAGPEGAEGGQRGERQEEPLAPQTHHGLTRKK